MAPLATFHTIAGRTVVVDHAAPPHYESAGVVWHCEGCGERSYWPLNTGGVVDDTALTTAVARGHATTCRI
jgi:hypothetical protein